MKIRLAKKVLYSKLYREKHKKQRPPYWDENRKQWVFPSWHNLPDIQKARTRYLRWLGSYKQKS